MALKEGTNAPAFDAIDQESKRHTLADYAGRWLLLYFYPKDNTSGCTTEACSFRDNLGTLASKDVSVVGVSTDSLESHRSFAQKLSLSFPLLVDEDRKIVRAYDVLEGDATKRTSYLIDPVGMIVRTYENVQPETHVQELLQDIDDMKK